MISKTVLFEVEGPFEIPFLSPGAGVSKRIDKTHARDFWTNPEVAVFASAVGCYVFGLKAGKGYTPWYVGKATQGFQQEVFTPHKLGKYNDVVFHGHKGTPVVWFVVRPGRRSAAGAKQIDDVESYLIQAAYQKNPELTNKQKVAGPPWGIRGVVRGGKGKASNTTLQFKGMMGLAKTLVRPKRDPHSNEDHSRILTSVAEAVLDDSSGVEETAVVASEALIVTE